MYPCRITKYYNLERASLASFLSCLNIRPSKNMNQSAEGAGGLVIIRGNKVGESE